jgi:hypothetical protein
MALQPFVGPWPLFSVSILNTVGRALWTGDQPDARPLPTHTQDNTDTEETYTDIHASNEIRTYDPMKG